MNSSSVKPAEAHEARGAARVLSESLKEPLRRNSLFLLATHGVIALVGSSLEIADGRYGEEAVGRRLLWCLQCCSCIPWPGWGLILD